MSLDKKCFILLFSESQKPVGYDSVRAIFSYVTELQIVNALRTSEDIESAVTKLCADQAGSSHNDPLQSYASMFSNELWEQDEIMEISEIQHVDEHEEIGVDSEEDFNSKLKELSNNSMESGGKIRLKVRRSCIWEDTVAKMKRVRREGLSGLVTVQFIGEPAVDEGGPRKEFFYLVHKHMQQV